jgi:hypothetical protein
MRGSMLQDALRALRALYAVVPPERWKMLPGALPGPFLDCEKLGLSAGRSAEI